MGSRRGGLADGGGDAGIHRMLHTRFESKELIREEEEEEV